MTQQMREAVNLVFVLLNYRDYELTVRAAESIIDKLDGENYTIVIVENGSNNESAKYLAEYCAGKDRVNLVVSDENLGFARGNNLGINYAKRHYSFQYLITMNSDVVLLQSKLFESIDQIYNETRFGALGPLVLDGESRFDFSPIPTVDKTRAHKLLRKFKLKDKLLTGRLGTMILWILRLKGKVVQHSSCDSIYYITPHSNVTISGCFMVFSPKFFQKFDGFNENTFLFWEEAILKLQMEKVGLSMCYDPRIIVFHQRGGSSARLSRSYLQWDRMRTRYYIESLKVLLAEFDR